jgi:hypothetical protein
MNLQEKLATVDLLKIFEDNKNIFSFYDLKKKKKSRTKKKKSYMKIVK